MVKYIIPLCSLPIHQKRSYGHSAYQQMSTQTACASNDEGWQALICRGKIVDGGNLISNLYVFLSWLVDFQFGLPLLQCHILKSQLRLESILPLVLCDQAEAQPELSQWEAWNTGFKRLFQIQTEVLALVLPLSIVFLRLFQTNLLKQSNMHISRL